MTYEATSQPHHASHRGSWFSRAEAWLDSKGKGAWMAAMILGFIFLWPVGLALLFYMIWSKQMFACSSKKARHASWSAAKTAVRPSGNTAFDAYKADTLKRLEDEQHQFEAFLERLRAAKDKAEFDEFMEDRAQRANQEPEKEDA